MNEEGLRVMARLQVLIATKNAQAMADPLRYLEEAYGQLMKARECFDKLQYALSPDIVFETAERMRIEPCNFNGEAKVRCDAAMEILKDYLNAN